MSYPFKVCWEIKEAKLKHSAVDSALKFSLGEEEMKIKSKRSHIIDMSGMVLFLLAPALLESGQPMCFPFSVQEIGRAKLQAGLPNKPVACLCCSFFGMTDLLDHPWLSQLAFNHKHTTKETL